jgi:hypothetical protein
MIGEDKINVAFGEGPIEGEFLIGGVWRYQGRRARGCVLEDTGT